MSNTNGTFVTLEGLDGSGKTSVAQAIQSEYKSVIRTQEPSDLWTGMQVRRAIANENEDTHPLTTFFLLMADRTHHIETRIQGGLDDGMMVVSDRFADSTLAYQPHALEDHIRFPGQYMERIMHPWNLEPDLTIYLDISVDTAIERSDGDEEYENREFLEAVKANYDELRTRYDDRYVTIDAEKPQDHVQREVLQIIEGHYTQT